MSIAAGTKLGRYEIRSKTGAGGMGEVYRARDEKLSRRCGNQMRATLERALSEGSPSPQN